MTYLTDLPSPVVYLIQSSVNCEFGTVSSAGVPINSPMGYFASQDFSTLDVATGLAYPTKAERVRKNPKVGLLLEGGPEEPVVAIAGRGAVRDLQQNSERYIAETAFRRVGDVPWELAKNAVWYWTRMLIEITPARILWWDNPAAMDSAPHRWEAAADTDYPTSDPVPPGTPSTAPKWPERRWQDLAAQAFGRNAPGHLTLCDDEGYPLSVRARRIELADDGFCLDVPKGAPWQCKGKATLTFDGRETFVGDVIADGDATMFRMERPLPVHPTMDNPLSLWTPNPDVREAFMADSTTTARRGQPIPTVAEQEPVPTAGARLRMGRLRAFGRPKDI